MEHEEALKIGKARATRAAEAIEKWTGARAYAACVVKPPEDAGDCPPDEWVPVGERSWKEVLCDEGFNGGGDFYLLVVDEDGVPKASTVARFALREVLALAERLSMPVAAPGRGELWRLMGEEEDRRNARHWALHMEA